MPPLHHWFGTIIAARTTKDKAKRRVLWVYWYPLGYRWRDWLVGPALAIGELRSIAFGVKTASRPNFPVWPAPGSEDTELGVLMEPEVGHGETEVYARVQA